VFRGREKVYAKQLYGFAKTKGISKKLLKLYLKAYGYKVKKCGPGPGVPWAYINKNPDWKDQLKVFSSAELQAPVAAEEEVKRKEEADFEAGTDIKGCYFDDI
jgi:hypothetical protein